MLLPLLLAVSLNVPLSGTTWVLTGLDLGRGELRPGPALTAPTLRVDGAAVGGSAGCSPLTASVRRRGQALVFRHIDAGTGDRCPDHALALREDYVALLRGVTRYAVRGDRLTLYAGRGRLSFRARGEASSRWPGRVSAGGQGDSSP